MKKTKIISLIAAIIATVAVWYVLNGRKAEQFSQESLRSVVTARISISEGTIIEEGMLEVKQIPSAYVSGAAFENVKDVVRNVARGDIAPGEQITKGRLSSSEADEVGLAYRIQKGKRAFTLELGVESGVAGLIVPGNKVDILVTSMDEMGEMVTTYLLEQVEVLAVDSLIGKWEGTGGTMYGSITLAVTPEEALQVEISTFMARNRYDGNVRVTLRPQDDEGVSTENAAYAGTVPMFPAGFLPQQTTEPE